MNSKILAGLILVGFVSASFSSLRGGMRPSLGEIAKEKFHLDQAGEDDVGYAQAVRVGTTIYISGSVGDGTDLGTQLRQAYKSIDKSLTRYGATFQNVVKENIFTTDLDEMIKQKDVRREFYQGDWPAASWVGVRSLYVPAILVQVEVIAELPRERK